VKYEEFARFESESTKMDNETRGINFILHLDKNVLFLSCFNVLTVLSVKTFVNIVTFGNLPKHPD